MRIVQKLFPSDNAKLLSFVKKRDLEGVRRLLEKGVDPNVIGPDGYGPLHWAASRNQLDMIRELISGGADIEKTIPDDNMTALHCAAWAGERVALRLLVELGADINAITATKKTALHCACLADEYKSVEMLLSMGADMTICDYEMGGTAFHYSVALRDDVIAEMFLEHGMDVNARTLLFGWTALHLAAASGKVQMVEFLLRHGADVNATSTVDMTPLMKAREQGQAEVAAILEAHMKA